MLLGESATPQRRKNRPFRISGAASDLIWTHSVGAFKGSECEGSAVYVHLLHARKTSIASLAVQYICTWGILRVTTLLRNHGYERP